MNESKSDQERDFQSILVTMLQLGEQRDKSISEIDEAIDRLKDNRKPTVEGKEPVNSLTKTETAIIPILRKRLSDMEDANMRLILISNRLNELA